KCDFTFAGNVTVNLGDCLAFADWAPDFSDFHSQFQSSPRRHLCFELTLIYPGKERQSSFELLFLKQRHSAHLCQRFYDKYARPGSIFRKMSREERFIS